MITCAKYAHLGNEGNPDFDWSAYEDGWNGTGLKPNKKIRLKNKKDVVYCHEPYAQDLYYKMNKISVDNAKDLHKGDTVSVSDLHIVDENTAIAVIGNGANNVLVDLNKEAKFYSKFSYHGEVVSRDKFVNGVKNDPTFKKEILEKNLTIKIGTDTEKGSLIDGYVEKMTKELKEQITKNNQAYYAEILDTNGGGFVVEVAGTIRAFMPGSMAAINRITNYNAFIGKTLEVMVESWTPKYGFVVSRKKYLNRMRPFKIQPIREALKTNPDKIYTGVVTGATQFGVFVELDEFITGMLHKTLVSDETREKMRTGEIQPGTEVQVYVHRIDTIKRGDEETERVILSDVPTAERDAVIEKRTAEDNQEKSAHLAEKAAAQNQDGNYKPARHNNQHQNNNSEE